jgi:hypothetical protein
MRISFQLSYVQRIKNAKKIPQVAVSFQLSYIQRIKKAKKIQQLDELLKFRSAFHMFRPLVSFSGTARAVFRGEEGAAPQGTNP